MAQPIHIALTFDDKFWAPAFATMRSVCLTTKRRKDLCFHLCHRTLAPEHKADFEKITAEFGATVRYYDIDAMPMFKSLASRARYNWRLSNIVYARLLFSEIMPPEVTRLTYLDCDIMLRAPIERIAEIDLAGYPIAAVRDPYGMQIMMSRDIRKNADLFDAASPYFNAGLIVIDMAGWRHAKIIEKTERAIADGVLERIYYDQDLLNLIFQDNWLPLDQLWNMVDPRPIHHTLNPYLLHYTGPQKPWNRLSVVAFARMYRHVMTNELYFRYMRYRWMRNATLPFRMVAKLVSRTK